MLEIGKSPGRTPLISEKLKETLKQELSDPEGFDSYKEIQRWLKSVHDVEASLLNPALKGEVLYSA